MKFAEDIVNFTLAEIALFLIFVLLIGYSGLKLQIENNKENSAAKAVDIEQAKSELIKKDNEISNLKDELQKYISIDKNLKSRIVPGCMEKGIQKDYLFKALIIERDTYQIDSANYSFSEILNKYKNEIENAKKNGCCLQIKVEYVSNISATDFDDALKQLEGVFYIRRLKAK